MYVQLKIKQWICLCLISYIIFLTACSENKLSDKEVFLSYIEELDFKLSKGEQTVIIVPALSCVGCRKVAVEYGEIKDNVTVIVSGRIASEFKNKDVIVDTNSICDILNWEHFNIIEITALNGEIETIKSYDAKEIIKRFTSVDTCNL